MSQHLLPLHPLLCGACHFHNLVAEHVVHGRVILPCAVNLEMASGVLGGQELVHDHDVPRRQRPRKMRERARRGCCSRWTAPRCRLECSRHLWCYHVASRARSGTRIPHFSRLLLIEVSLLPHAADCRAAVSRERARSTRGRDLSFEVNGRGQQPRWLQEQGPERGHCATVYGSLSARNRIRVLADWLRLCTLFGQRAPRRRRLGDQCVVGDAGRRTVRVVRLRAGSIAAGALEGVQGACAPAVARS